VTSSIPQEQALAGVDLGSNSFHMIVARVIQGQIHVLDRVRDRVQLAAGLDDRRELTRDAQERALACLERFGQRVRAFPYGSVRAVGTNTLRQAKNAREFLDRAQDLLGHPIEIISGREEARLIYLGVAHDLSDDAGRRLVIDIGGGSTECILGERFEPLETESLYMGCVSHSLRFFPGGKIRRDDWRRAEIAAHLELRPIKRRYRGMGWQDAIGSSGTIASVDQVLRASGSGDKGITLKGLKRLKKELLSEGRVPELPGLPPDRSSVFAGGVAILLAIFEGLGIERMTAASGALREGLLYDLLGRIRHEDVRDQTIRRFSDRYHVDLEQASRVERTAVALFEQCSSSWELGGDEVRQFLSWAARLHEIGLSISHTGYHKHSAYLIEHADMPGFSRDDQLLLSTLVRNHRRKLARDSFRAIASARAKTALRLCVLLRLAVCLNRSRGPDLPPRMRLWAKGSSLELAFPAGWLEEHPLTLADLEEEAGRLDTAALRLELAA
jgi:exopolyphosphatase / guanosine-5'-triphosphate,3'-diphosphate pyrophosphatase